jgi:hypothetical protein
MKAAVAEQRDGITDHGLQDPIDVFYQALDIVNEPLPMAIVMTGVSNSAHLTSDERAVETEKNS